MPVLLRGVCQKCKRPVLVRVNEEAREHTRPSKIGECVSQVKCEGTGLPAIAGTVSQIKKVRR